MKRTIPLSAKQTSSVKDEYLGKTPGGALKRTIPLLAKQTSSVKDECLGKTLGGAGVLELCSLGVLCHPQHLTWWPLGREGS